MAIKKLWARFAYDALLAVCILGILCALEQPAKAFLGLPQIVFDPAVEATVSTISGLTGGILGINTSTLAKVIQETQLALAEYQRISTAQRAGWRTAAQMPSVDVTLNRAGELAGWDVMSNGKVGIANQVWARATLGVTPNTGTWGEEIPGQSKILAPLASIGAVDGTASRCLDQVAQVRANGLLNRPIIQNLLSAQMDSGDAFNGTVGQINITNGTLEEGNEESRTQTAIQTCMVEQAALANKMNRDMLAEALNMQALVHTEIAFKATSPDGNTTFTHQLP